MKKLLVSLGVSLLVGGVGVGAPNYTAERGLRNILSASPERFGKFNYTIGVEGLYITSSDPVDSLLYWNPSAGDTGAWVWTGSGKKDRCWIGDITFGVGFSFTDYLSLNLHTVYLIDVMRTDIKAEGSGAVSYGLGDTYLGMKFTPTRLFPLISSEFTRVFELGIYPMVSFATGEEREEPEIRCAADTVYGEPCRLLEGGIHRFYTAGELTSGVKALLTFNIQTEPKLPIHLNFGYMSYPYREASKMSYGIGIECIYPKFIPFIELYGEERMVYTYNDGGVYLSPGLRFETAPDVWVTFGLDFRLSSERPEINNKEYHIQGGFGSAPPWVANLTISQGYDFRPPPPPGKAIIAGKVMDEQSQSVLATVFFSDTNVTTDANGNYKIELAPGKIIAYASPVDKEAYLPSDEVTKYVVGGEKEIINFRLKSKPKVEKEKPSILTGKIIDKSTTTPLIATISFPGTSVASLQSATSGIYRTELAAQTYIVKVEKDGYIPQTHPVVCNQGATTILDVALSPIVRGSTIVGKVSDYSSHKGISATISFPGTNIATITTDPQTGIYKAQIPDGTHQVKVEAPDYVPEGAVIICKPGETVTRDFELFKKEERIVLRGINFEYNSAVILPSSYPVLDNAVELLKKHPDIVVEIGGHTCSMGSDQYNLRLSQLRAESVRNYLIQQGIPAHRLQTRGYGEVMPITDNSTEAGRSLNRRIEFRIISQ